MVQLITFCHSKRDCQSTPILYTCTQKDLKGESISLQLKIIAHVDILMKSKVIVQNIGYMHIILPKLQILQLIFLKIELEKISIRHLKIQNKLKMILIVSVRQQQKKIEINKHYSFHINWWMIVIKFNDLLQSLHPDKNQKQSSPPMNICHIIQRVNVTEENRDGQNKRSSIDGIKIRGISYKRSKQGNPRLAWIMFHTIVLMF